MTIQQYLGIAVVALFTVLLLVSLATGVAVETRNVSRPTNISRAKTPFKYWGRIANFLVGIALGLLFIFGPDVLALPTR